MCGCLDMQTVLQASFKAQLRALSVRLMRNAYRHPFLIALNFVATLAAAIGLALIFHNTGTDTGGIQNRWGPWRFRVYHAQFL